MALKKLTSNTRWDEIDGEVYIFARKPGDQKWSKAYLPSCNNRSDKKSRTTRSSSKKFTDPL